MELTGTILTGTDFHPVSGRLVVDDGRITAIEEAAVASDDIICPAFVNAHTHLGDSIAKEAGVSEQLSLAELVAPPDGLKHRLLRSASTEELIAGMRRSMQYMLASGVTACIDFREGGVEGVRAFRAAADGLALNALAYGRETTEVLEVADGFGASGAADADFTEEREAARTAGKPFAIHAGEADPTDIDPALALEPDLLIHMVHPTADHLARLESAGTPVVVCPRSNLVTDVGMPPVEQLLERTTVGLGTDNVMFNAPSMFREMAYMAKQTGLPARTILRMATDNGASIADLDCGVLEPGRPARLLVLDGDSDNLAGIEDPVDAVVRRATTADVRDVMSE